MEAIGAYEAKTHLPRLLAEVEEGHSVTITRHGRPVARLVPFSPPADTVGLVGELLRSRQGVRRGDVTVRSMIDGDPA